MNILEIEGIGDVYRRKLVDFGISTVEALLEHGATPQGREHIAEGAGCPAALVLEWVNLADLMRIKGVGSEYSDLLEEAGVDTVPELAQRNPENLHAAITKAIEDKGLVRRPPSAADVESWVAQAKELGRTITY